MAPAGVRAAGARALGAGDGLDSASAAAPGEAQPAAGAATNKTEYVVDVKSFLLGSHVDLVKLRPKFQDVLRAQGKDYLVLGFRPVDGGAAEDDTHLFSDAPPPPVPEEERAGAA